jgi:primosomal protein N' (replication factor Y)
MTERQQRLFDQEPAPWEEDDAGEQLVATVVFAGGPGGEFDYSVPDSLADETEPGRRVQVPLGRGNRLVVGYCVRLETRPIAGRPLKPLSGVMDHRRLLSPSMLRLTEWIAEHYLCDLGQVLEAVVPAGVRAQAGTRLTTVLFVEPEVAARLDSLDLPKKQALALRELAAADRPMTAVELGRAANCTKAPIDSLRRKGLIRAKTHRGDVQRPTEADIPREAHLELNPDQQTALNAILDALSSRRHRTILIHGVTGSGKTEVYIQAIQEVVHFGRQAIVLVPEISLTPQTVQRFHSRFPHVAVLHSHLSDAERHWQWQEIADGRVQVVVGARSAVFAPTPNLGLVVLDEEHETTFKQETAPRYHARDVAVMRCQAEDVPLVLGSATPSLESWHRAQSGRYQLVDLPRRVFGRPLPAVGTLDLRDDANTRFSRGSISRNLHAAIEKSLAADGQVILLLNRRGYSTHIQCPACGMVLACPHCEIALTHHRTEEIALCHYCDHQVPAPNECPECHFRGIRYSGQGTQRLEAEVRARFPKARALRMDTDSMRGRQAHQRALDAFRKGEVRILLGTQMIAKGLDFPNVTLVGVINADTALHLPDFRAAERTFQLVTQVAGRTGRGEKGGRVLVQTYNPDHPAILAAVRHDYAAFAAGELPARKMLGYPPFSSMIRLVVRGPKEEVAGQFAAHVGQRLTECLEAAGASARVLGPAPAPFAKLRGKYRFQIQVQGPDSETLRQGVRAATTDLKPPEEVQWIVDVDPVDML